MAHSPAFRFYPQDFLHGTRNFKTEEIGAYILLLCEQWDKGFIPTSEQELKEITQLSLKKLSKVLKKFNGTTNLGNINIRLEREREKQQKYSEMQSSKGSKGGRPRKDEKSQKKPEVSNGLTEKSLSFTSSVLSKDNTIPLSLSNGFPEEKPQTDSTPAITLGDFLNGMDVKGYLPIEELKARSLGDNAFVGACFQIGLMPDALPAWLDAFGRWLQFSNDTLKQEKDYRFHFRNWINKQNYKNGTAEDYQPMTDGSKPEAPKTQIHKTASQILAERKAAQQ